MEEKKLIILGIYLKSDNISRSRFSEIVEKIQEQDPFKLHRDYEIKALYIPSNETRIETIFPIYTTKEKADEKINKIMKDYSTLAKNANKKSYLTEHNNIVMRTLKILKVFKK